MLNARALQKISAASPASFEDLARICKDEKSLPLSMMQQYRGSSGSEGRVGLKVSKTSAFTSP